MLYPQNGDRIVAIDSVTSLHPMYNDVRRQNAHLLVASRMYSVSLQVVYYSSVALWPTVQATI